VGHAAGRVLGVDIGGTKIAAAVVDPGGQLGPFARVSTPASDGPRAVLDAAIGAARTVLGEYAGRDGGGPAARVQACGVGTAGTVDPDGVISHATDALPGWAGTDVRSAFASALGVPVAVVNDVHAAAVGEQIHGAAEGRCSALVVWVGTGIGGAIVSNGTVVSGRSSTAGAVGHVPVSEHCATGGRRRCTCGGWDHLEAYASGPAITERYFRLAAEGRFTPADLRADLADIAAFARSGDQLGLSVIQEAGGALGAVLGGLANVLDPDVIVVGGGVTAIWDLLDGPVRQGLASHALPGPADVELAVSTLGPKAVLVGAAEAARAILPEF
jgi:glucokinase